MKKSGLIWLLIFVTAATKAQNTIGLPDVKNYFKQTYKAGAQNRMVKQDRKGILYFANTEGVLSFDGTNWKVYPLPNKCIVRSVEFGPDNKLYAGGQDEFGYFSPDAKGELQFHSLRHLLPESDRSFTDVWDIYFYRDLIFFQTSDRIYQISGKHCSVYKSAHWKYMGVYKDRLIAQDHLKGLLSFQNGVWGPFLDASDLPAESIISSVLPIGGDTTLITTESDGFYLLANNRVTRFRSAFLDGITDKNVSSATMVNENHIAISTNLDGCFIIDRKGNHIQSFASREGLQNINVLDIFMDNEKNLWLGLDNGIDFIAYNNAIKHIYPNYLNEGSGYAAAIYKNELYIGTSNGLFKAPLNDAEDLSYVKGRFEPVSNSQGQVYNLSEVNGKLLMGHHQGAFMIENGQARLIDKSSGFWTFQPLSNVLPSSLMVTGTYQGLKFYNYENGEFVSHNLFANFESARFVVIDNNTIWVSHPYRGIYRAQLVNDKPVVKYYSAKEGVTAVNHNYIFKIKNRIILTTENGIFEYNAAADKFEPSEFYNELFGKKSIRHLKEDGAGNIWFVFEKILGVVDFSGEKPEIIYFPELTNKYVSGFEHIYPVNSKNVFIGGEKGFYHINYELYKKIKFPLKVHIATVKAVNQKDSLLFGGYNSETMKQTEISHSWNSFEFAFSAPMYAQQANISYSYYLEGFEDQWSEFSQKTEKEYTNLPAGTYTFRVKARNNLGNESDITGFTFTVLPAWYQSNIAKAVYVLLFLAIAYLLYRYQRKKFIAQQKKHKEEQERLQYLHQLEMDKTEKELVKLRNEKLEAEIIHKNTELASVAMHLVQKGELLGKVKEQMIKLKKTTYDEKEDDVKKIIRAISDEEKMDQQWEQFAMHFDNVHTDFLVELKNKYPELTANEVKLCAYLRMNLATKEIAQLMNISVRGVEISRYRLRKKLQIPTQMNLFNFLMAIKKEARVLQ